MREVGHEMQSRAKTNVLTIADKCCSCGKWQEYKYPCMHAMAYLWKWEQLVFPTILQYHGHDYYQSKRLQHPMITVSSWLYKIKFSMMEKLIHQVYGRNNPDVQRRNCSGNGVNSLILEIHQLFVVFVGKVDTTGGHVQGQIQQQKQNSQETGPAKNKILDH